MLPPTAVCRDILVGPASPASPFSIPDCRDVIADGRNSENPVWLPQVIAQKQEERRKCCHLNIIYKLFPHGRNSTKFTSIFKLFLPAKPQSFASFRGPFFIFLSFARSVTLVHSLPLAHYHYLILIHSFPCNQTFFFSLNIFLSHLLTTTFYLSILLYLYISLYLTI